MIRHDLLARARELALHHEKDTGLHGTATMLIDLINEIERMREAARGAIVVVSTAKADRDAMVQEALDAQASVVMLSIDNSILRKALDQLCSYMLDLAESELGRELRPAEMPVEWRMAVKVLADTAPKKRGAAA